MFKRNNNLHFLVDGHDIAFTDPFEAATAALDARLSGGDEMPSTIQIHLAEEVCAEIPHREINDMAYRLAEDLGVEGDLFSEAKNRLKYRLKWAAMTCSTGVFTTLDRYLAVRVVEVEADEEWIIHPEDEEALLAWLEMEEGLCRTKQREEEE